ncbi:hypothetical protein NDU88_000585 [Pleurodeles waltl]|uniref:Uncharacterized protein n=1 Tax=Pleurodeles waltl TaxID=8319 RepID=A0AAV7KW00_PLEWA|nr:hypothetical protein NDU88_000585 [Pleurodeles waltl]
MAFKPCLCFKAAAHLLLSCLLPVCLAQSTLPGCQLKRDSVSGFSRDGDILLGGIFRVHFSALQPLLTFQEEPVAATCQTVALKAAHKRCPVQSGRYEEWQLIFEDIRSMISLLG